ncbi:MAG TPA: phosphoribosylformylglycinamidine synthase subunit PurL [Terriglobales bacterium]|nr:phosphoribosylformylglycinamidine synthase subunit PurL [Terriglobales bacterium]
MATQPLQSAPPACRATPELLKTHGITGDEYERIVQALGREPSLTELGIYSVMWSEHCSYKSSKVHLKRLPTRSARVVQGPGENAGIIDIGDGWACAFKIESHNHPSYIEPFQGAATGVGGILRDIFTMGARPLAVMDSLRFGAIEAAKPRSRAASKLNGERQPQGPSANMSSQDDDKARNAQELSSLEAQKLLHKTHSILEGVVSGIASYGNCFGVPNLGGETKFEECYSGNPLVNAFALGLVRKDEIFYAKAAGEGNPVIYVGAKTGRDGIHGATMASEEFKEGLEQKRPNVQVGDPFLEKLLLEACLEAMRTGAIIGIQDMGAAGLTCSTCEMGARGAVGIEIELDRVPQREQGMNAYEIMLSESQERMLLVAERGREKEVFRVFNKWGLDAVTIGRVIREPRLRVLEHGNIVADIPNTSLTDDAPVYRRPMQQWSAPVPKDKPASLQLGMNDDFTDELKALLASPNICSKRWIHEQYDSMVQTNTVEGPGGDAGVMRIKGTRRGLAMSLDGNGRWCYLNPKLGAMHAVAEAARKVACVGGVPVAATNCLNFANPEKPQIMWQFSEVIDGMAEACNVLGTPITGGNVSLYNETLGEGIYPTPVIGVVGIVEDISHAATPDFKAGHEVLLLSAPTSAYDESQLGSSEYAKVIVGTLWGNPPALDLKAEAALQECVLQLIREDLIEAAHDCSDGGIAVALAESCFRHEVGAELRLPETPEPAEIALFGERASRVVVSCDPQKRERINNVAAFHSIKAEFLGATGADRFVVRRGTSTLVSGYTCDLKNVWGRAFESALHSELPDHLVPEILDK